MATLLTQRDGYNNNNNKNNNNMCIHIYTCVRERACWARQHTHLFRFLWVRMASQCCIGLPSAAMRRCVGHPAVRVLDCFKSVAPPRWCLAEWPPTSSSSVQLARLAHIRAWCYRSTGQTLREAEVYREEMPLFYQNCPAWRSSIDGFASINLK